MPIEFIHENLSFLTYAFGFTGVADLQQLLQMPRLQHFRITASPRVNHISILEIYTNHCKRYICHYYNEIKQRPNTLLQFLRKYCFQLSYDQS